MPHLYGDSTVFPYDIDYIQLSRGAVDCAVQLLSAQHAISSALERAEALGSVRADLVERVTAMSRTLKGGLESSAKSDSAQLERIAGRILECVEGVVVEEVARIEQQAGEEVSHMRNIVSRSAESAQRALEAFLQRHDVPGTDVALTWAAAGEHDYAGQVAVRTPFGIVAAFTLGIPSDHAWARPRRVQEIEPGLEIHFPQQSGWLSKRVEMAAVKLDKLYVSGVRVDAISAELRLRKGPCSGAGYRILVELQGDQKISLSHLADDGTLDGEPALTVEGDDREQIFRLATRVIDSACELSALRRSLVSAELDGQALTESGWPGAVAERLIGCLAPVVTEIAKRSGAPGELVLRRDVGGGRREEMYVTQAELYEKVLVLPPERRRLFAALGLGEPASDPPAPRNLRPSLAAQMAAAASVGPIG